jgi:hypothetical protein
LKPSQERKPPYFATQIPNADKLARQVRAKFQPSNRAAREGAEMSSLGQQFPNDPNAGGDLDAYRLVRLGIPPDQAVRLAAAARARQMSAPPSAVPDSAPAQFHLTGRDKSYLDRYAPSVIAHSKAHDVDPAFALGVGLLESGGASAGTYTKSNDAFGMTNGSPETMSRFPPGPAGVEPDVSKFFDVYGERIRGVGSDEGAFCNALQGLDSSGHAVEGRRRYNSKNTNYCDALHANIESVRRALPAWHALQSSGAPNP